MPNCFREQTFGALNKAKGERLNAIILEFGAAATAAPFFAHDLADSLR
jgi:hypothetical protein